MGSLTGPIDAAFGFMGHSAQKKQTKNMIRDYNNAEQQSLGDLAGARDASLGYYQPYLQGGQNAFNAAGQMLQPGHDYQSSDPGYNYIYNEAMRGANMNAAANGAYGSGGTLKALQRNAAGLAAQDFNNAFNRQNTLAQYGMQAANGSALAQSGYAQNATRTRFAAADGRTGAREMRGEAIAKQWGDAGNFIEGVGKFFGI